MRTHNNNTHGHIGSASKMERRERRAKMNMRERFIRWGKEWFKNLNSCSLKIELNQQRHFSINRPLSTKGRCSKTTYAIVGNKLIGSSSWLKIPLLCNNIIIVNLSDKSEQFNRSYVLKLDKLRYITLFYHKIQRTSAISQLLQVNNN